MATSTASVTTDTTNYTRIHLILMKGGTLLTKTLFLKRVKDLSPAGHEFTVDEFLGKHRVQILSTSTGRNNEEKLYPPTGTSTNLDEWDLPLYCFILKTVCGLPNINKLDMKLLKTIRNELAHLHDPSLTDADFKSHLITIELIFTRSYQMINDPSFEKEMKVLLQKCETGALAVDEVVKVHHDSNRKHIELLNNQVKMMKNQVDMIKNQSVMLQNQTTHEEKIDSALSMLTEIKDRLPPNPDVDIPDVHVIIEVKNCTKEKEKELLDFLVKQFNETISDPECTLNKDFPNLAMYTISEAICKTLKSFLEKGRHLLKVENGSISLTVKCNNISSFVGLIRDYIDGTLLDHVSDLKDAIQSWDGCTYIDFDLIISPDEITEAILKLAKNLDEIVPKGIQVNVPPEELSSSTMFDLNTSKEDTSTSCSTSNIFRLEIKPETDDQRTEIEKCFSSGSISEIFERCQRQFRKDPHFTNVEIEAKLLAVDNPRTASRTFQVDDTWSSEHRERLIEDITIRTTFKSVNYAKILFLGPVGAGKSSLISSFASIDKDRISMPALAGTTYSYLISTKVLQYIPKWRLRGKYRLIDTMGIEEVKGKGFDVKDLVFLMEGNIKPSYKFKPEKPVDPANDPEYIQNPTLEDKPQCSVLVMDSTLIHSDAISEETKLKFAELQRHINEKQIPVVVLLTKIDKICKAERIDIKTIFRNGKIKELIDKAAKIFGVPEMNIFPVQSYRIETELDRNIDILLLLALRKMLHISDDHLEDMDDQTK